MGSTNRESREPPDGLRAMFGSTNEGLALFRISLGIMLTIELATRFRYLHPFYSDEGTLPLRLLLPKIDDLYKAVSLHVHLHKLWHLQVVLSVQVIAAILFTIGYKTKLMAVISWYLYLSLTLRNTWLNFILDRYFHYLLFYAMFLPLDKRWSIGSFTQKQHHNRRESKGIIVSPATIALKMLIFWIYLDAGAGKYLDPLEGWTYNAKPLPALDTYTRHTTFARYMYAILGPEGLRTMTPAVVWVELLAAPLAFLGSYFGSAELVKAAVGLIWQLHLGIALCMNNAFLLSLVACCPWFIFLPVGWNATSNEKDSAGMASSKTSLGRLFSTIIILSMIAGNLWFETISESCDQTIFYSTIFHCRWNVFVGAEEYVTWEIAPGQLADGAIVDVWARTNEVKWSMPGAGAPCTSTSRPGRWRSFPYLADLKGEDGEVLWSYLCKQWDRENDADRFPERKLLKFNFFMLQADVLPNMGFSATRKRLIHSHDCLISEQGGSNFNLPSQAIEEQPETHSNDKLSNSEQLDTASDTYEAKENDEEAAIESSDTSNEAPQDSIGNQVHQPEKSESAKEEL